MWRDYTPWSAGASCTLFAMDSLAGAENPNVTDEQLASAISLVEAFLAERGFEAYLTIEVEDNSYEESSS